jgi:predicted component of type VI protein secretion system
MAQIILTRQNQVLSQHQIPPSGELTIGRNPQNRLVIDHLSVSGRHAAISHQDDGLILIDSGSTNGTFVNNQRVAEARLGHQDWVTVGNHTLIVDLYETLSLEATAQMLQDAETPASQGADQTLMVDMASSSGSDLAFDSLTFLAGGHGDYELFKNQVTIGKNRDADIVINGFWSFLAGSPAAVIQRTSGAYWLQYIHGLFKPKINGLIVKGKTRLRNGDIIHVGPLKLRINLTP